MSILHATITEVIELSTPIPPVTDDTPVLPSYVAPYKPVPQVTPFTYRDGVTMLKKLTGLTNYINRVIVPFVNENFAELSGEFETQINALIVAVNEALAAQDAEVDQKIADLTTYVNDTVQGIVDNSITVQDSVIAGAINDPESETRAALNALTPDDADIAALISDTESATRAAIDAIAPDDADIANLITTDGTATNNAIDARVGPLEILVSTGRLSASTLDATYADQATEDTVNTGRLSEENLLNTIYDAVLVASSGVAARVAMASGGLTIAAATEVAVPFAAELFDTSNMHDNAVNNTRITVPDAGGPGFYMAVAQCEWGGSGLVGTPRGLSLKKNGTSYIGQNTLIKGVSGQRMQVHAIDYLLPGDYVEVLAYNGDTAADGIFPYIGSATSSTLGYNAFSLVKINPSISDVDISGLYAHFAALYSSNLFNVNE